MSAALATQLVQYTHRDPWRWPYLKRIVPWQYMVNKKLHTTTARQSCSWRPMVAASCCLSWRKSTASRPSWKAQKLLANMLPYSHETRPVLDWTRIRVSLLYSLFSLACSKAQKEHNVLNSLIGIRRMSCSCAQTALDLSSTKMTKTFLLMTYPTMHKFVLKRTFKSAAS